MSVVGTACMTRRRAPIGDCWYLFPAGAIAQLGERLLCKQEVVGSIPSGSTRWCDHGRLYRPRFSSFASFVIARTSLRRSARLLSDIVKRRSIQVLRVTCVTSGALSPGISVASLEWQAFAATQVAENARAEMLFVGKA
jgi:hypothetical protein